MEKLLTATQIAELLQVKESTIRDWTHTNFIPYIKFGRLVRYKESDILEWLEKRSKNKLKILDGEY